MASLTLIDAYALNATKHEKRHFKALWNVFLESIERSTPYLVLPQNLITEIGLAGLRDIVTRYSTLAAEDIHVFTDRDRSAYLIGPLLNIPSGPNITPFGLIADYGQSEPKLFNKVPDHGNVPNIGAPSQKVTKGAASKMKKIRKPPNAWILYRQHQQKCLSTEIKTLPCTELSKIISNMWNNENEEVKREFFRRAEVERERHAMENPDWKCTPRKSSSIKKRTSLKAAARFSSSSTELNPSSNTSFGCEVARNSANFNTFDNFQNNSEDSLVPEELALSRLIEKEQDHAEACIADSVEAKSFDSELLQHLHFLADDSFTNDSLGDRGDISSIGYATDSFRGILECRYRQL